MGASVVLRERAAAGAPVMPKALLRKNRPTWPERVWCVREFVVAAVGLLTVPVGILVVIFTPLDLIGSLGIGASVSVLIGGFTWAGITKDSVGARKAVLPFDRSRRDAPHAYERESRASDVTYPQFSTWVQRNGHELIVGVMRHEQPGWRWREHETTRFGFDAELGKWGTHDGKQVRLHEATLERADEVIREVDEVARDLEAQAYQSALSERQLERLVMLHRSPRGPLRERARHHADELDSDIATLGD